VGCRGVSIQFSHLGVRDLRSRSDSHRYSSADTDSNLFGRHDADGYGDYGYGDYGYGDYGLRDLVGSHR